MVTDTVVTTTTTTTVEEKYKVLAPESMQETFMSDSEDEGGKWQYYYTVKPNLDSLEFFILSHIDINASIIDQFYHGIFTGSLY